MTGSSHSFRSIQSRRTDRGAVIPMVAVSLAVLIIGTAFSIDLGRQMSRRRDMQAIADVIALDMGRLIDGRPRAALEDSKWFDQLEESRLRNDFGQEGARNLVAEPGVWSVDSQTFTPSPPEGIPNAVRVTARDIVSYFFAPGSGGVNRLAIATKGGEETVDFSMGSYLATVSPFQSGLLGGIIGQAFPGSTAFLDILSYRGLAAGNIDLGIVAAALGFGTANDLINAGEISAFDFFLASASALSCPNPPSPTAPCDSVAAINALNAIQQTITNQTTIDLGDFIFVQQGGPDAVVDVPQLNALGLVMGTAQVINGNNLVSIPGLTLNIPGLSTSTLNLQVIDGPEPARAFGVKPGPCVLIDPDDPDPDPAANCLQVPQVDLSLVTDFLPGPLPGLANVTGGLDIGVDLANARSHPIAQECGAPQSTTINLEAEAAAVVVSLRDFGVSVGLPLLPALEVSIDMDLPVVLNGGMASKTFLYESEFLPPPLGPPGGMGVEVPLGSSMLGLANAFQLRLNEISVSVLGVPLDVGDALRDLAVNAVFPLLNGLLAQLDQTLVKELVDSLGLSLGGGYVGAIDMDCDAGGFLKLVK